MRLSYRRRSIKMPSLREEKQQGAWLQKKNASCVIISQQNNYKVESLSYTERFFCKKWFRKERL
jgi:uncharacterized protein YecT (DUF1311 family)